MRALSMTESRGRHQDIRSWGIKNAAVRLLIVAAVVALLILSRLNAVAANAGSGATVRSPVAPTHRGTPKRRRINYDADCENLRDKLNDRNEQLVWAGVCSGNATKLPRDMHGGMGRLDAAFFRRILEQEEFRKQLIGRSVRVRGAEIVDGLHLESDLPAELVFDDSVFDGAVSFANASTDYPIRFHDSVIRDRLLLTDFKGSDVEFVRSSATEMDATSANLRGSLNVDGTVDRRLILDHAKIDGDTKVSGSLGTLSVRGANLTSVALNGLTVTHYADLASAQLEELTTKNLEIGLSGETPGDGGSPCGTRDPRTPPTKDASPVAGIDGRGSRIRKVDLNAKMPRGMVNFTQATVDRDFALTGRYRGVCAPEVTHGQVSFGGDNANEEKDNQIDGVFDLNGDQVDAAVALQFARIGGLNAVGGRFERLQIVGVDFEKGTLWVSDARLTGDLIIKDTLSPASILDLRNATIHGLLEILPGCPPPDPKAPQQSPSPTNPGDLEPPPPCGGLEIQPLEFRAINLQGISVDGATIIAHVKLSVTTWEQMFFNNQVLPNYEQRAPFSINGGEARFGSVLAISDIEEEANSDLALVFDQVAVGAFAAFERINWGRRARIRSESLVLDGATVHGNLRLDDVAVDRADLSEAHIDRTFFLTETVDEPSKTIRALELRNARVDSVEDRTGAPCARYPEVPEEPCFNPWPAKLDLLGFHYESLGSETGNAIRDMAARNSHWWSTRWLMPSGQPVAAPATFDHLADVVRSHGLAVQADQIMMMRKDVDADSSALPISQLWTLRLQGKLIGYGYLLYRAVVWTFFFVGLGMVVLQVSREGRRLRMPIGFSYSFDTFIPLITLDKKHESMELRGWARHYFYVHKIVGFVLASFVVAWVAVLSH